MAVALIVLALHLHRQRLARWTACISLSTLLALSILPLGDLLLQPIERRFPANPSLATVDGIVVLGGGEDARGTLYWDQVQLGQGGERYTEALALAHRFPEARIVFSGGSGALRDASGTVFSEADVAARFFAEQGTSAERLSLEGQSRNTAENARLSLLRADPAPDETWVLVTSAFHMPRAMRSFEAAGWSGLVAWPVDYRTAGFGDRLGWDLTRNLVVLDIALHEYVGQLAYRLTGR